MKKKLFPFLLLSLLAMEAHAQSTVSKFEYGSFEDRKTSTLEGNVLLLSDKKDTLKSDWICPITVDDHYGIPFKNLTPDSNGHFMIELPEGEFSIIFVKPGHESLLVENYRSKPGQKSTIEILLAKGKEFRIFKLKKWKQS